MVDIKKVSILNHLYIFVIILVCHLSPQSFVPEPLIEAVEASVVPVELKLVDGQMR